MNRIVAVAALVATMAFGLTDTPVKAQEFNPELAALQAALPGILINDPTRMDWDIYGQGQKNKRVKTPGVGGGFALQVTSPKAADAPHAIGVNVPIVAAITPGQPVTVAFWARAVSADTPDGAARVGLRIQQNASPYPGFGDTMLTIGPDWQIHEAKTQSNIAIDAGLAVVGFQMAAAKQVVEIGQVYVLDMTK